MLRPSHSDLPFTLSRIPVVTFPLPFLPLRWIFWVFARFCYSFGFLTSALTFRSGSLSKIYLSLQRHLRHLYRHARVHLGPHKHHARDDPPVRRCQRRPQHASLCPALNQPARQCHKRADRYPKYTAGKRGKYHRVAHSVPAVWGPPRLRADSVFVGAGRSTRALNGELPRVLLSLFALAFGRSCHEVYYSAAGGLEL